MYHWPALGSRRHVFEEILNILKFCSHSYFVRPGVQEHAVVAGMLLQEQEAPRRLPTLHRGQRSAQYRAAQGWSRVGVAAAKGRLFYHDFIREDAISVWEGYNRISEHAQRRRALTFLLEHAAVASDVELFTSLALTFPEHIAVEDHVVSAPAARMRASPGSLPCAGRRETVDGRYHERPCRGAAGRVLSLCADVCRKAKCAETLCAWGKACVVIHNLGGSKQRVFFCCYQEVTSDSREGLIARRLFSLAVPDCQRTSVGIHAMMQIGSTGGVPGCISEGWWRWSQLAWTRGRFAMNPYHQVTLLVPGELAIAENLASPGNGQSSRELHRTLQR